MGAAAATEKAEKSAPRRGPDGRLRLATFRVVIPPAIAIAREERPFGVTDRLPPVPSMTDPRGGVDVLVLSGGPAGCAAAIELARGGHAVAVLERSWYAEDRVGDTLAPARYQRTAEAGYRAYRAEWLRTYAQVTDWPDCPFWRRRARSGRDDTGSG